MHRFPVQRRHVRLDDQFITRGDDAHDRLSSLDDAADGLEFNVDYSSTHGSDHDSALQDVSARAQLFRHLGQIRADLLRIGGNLVRPLRFHREDLHFGFADLLAQPRNRGKIFSTLSRDLGVDAPEPKGLRLRYQTASDQILLRLQFLGNKFDLARRAFDLSFVALDLLRQLFDALGEDAFFRGMKRAPRIEDLLLRLDDASDLPVRREQLWRPLDPVLFGAFGLEPGLPG